MSEFKPIVGLNDFGLISEVFDSYLPLNLEFYKRIIRLKSIVFLFELV